MGASDRFENIDGLRAIAACFVIWLHVAEIFSQLGNQASSWLHTVLVSLDFGRTGVLVLFLISGFLIPSSLKGGRVEGLRKFAIRRFSRLYPLYWAIPQTDEAGWLRQLSLPVYMVFVFAALIAFSALTYRSIEAPMIALGQRLSRKSIPMPQPQALAA